MHNRNYKNFVEDDVCFLCLSMVFYPFCTSKFSFTYFKWKKLIGRNVEKYEELLKFITGRITYVR